MKTVKVRIAVAVDHAGAWNCCGSSNMNDNEMMGFAVEVLEDGEARYFLEAELALPECPTVAVDPVKAN